VTLDELNALPADEFVARLGGIFEHSPWVAEAVVAARPFASVGQLHAAMCGAVASAPVERQLALVRAHPELAGRAAIRDELTDASRREQSGAGLDQCSAQEFAQIGQLNAAYNGRFGFPFVVAVRGLTRGDIIDAMAVRLGNTPEEELAEALRQIERIAGFRLGDLLKNGS
jgi:OHCU decarboxylase